MFEIITDISDGKPESIKGLYKFPQSIIIKMWKELQWEHWYDRGQHPDVSTAEDDLKKFERLKKEAGCNG
jgi:hypothetical protein